MSPSDTPSQDVLSDLDASGSPVGFWQYLIEQCPVCDSTSLSHLFNGQGTPRVGCDHCGLVMPNPQPSDEALDEIYSSTYFLGSDTPTFNAEVYALKGQTAELYLDQINEFRRRHGIAGAGASLLDIGCGQGNLLLGGRARGYQGSGVEVSASALSTANQLLREPCVRHGTIEDVELPTESFDVCVMADVIEHTRHPAEFLKQAYRLVKPGGVIFIAVASLDSWSAR